MSLTRLWQQHWQHQLLWPPELLSQGKYHRDLSRLQALVHLVRIKLNRLLCPLLFPFKKILF